MKIVTVIPLKRGVFKENLTYFSNKEVAAGNIVTVSIKDKKVLALVVNVMEAETMKSDIKKLQYNLKKIIDVKVQNVFSTPLLESISLTAKYFVAKNSNAIVSLTPAIMRENYDKIARIKDQQTEITEDKIFIKNIKAEKLLFQVKFEDRISYYKTLIRGSFAQKKSVFIVLPTEKDIAEFAQVLEKGIEKFVISIHSGFSPKKQFKKIEQILTSSHPVLILGTAQYLTIGRKDVETIILEHENSNAYKLFVRPHIDLRTFTEIFASKIGARFIIGDFLLRYETIARKEFDNFGEVYPLLYRTNFNGEIKIIDNNENFKVISDACLNEIQATLFRRENIFIFSLRRGLATITICNDCGEPVLCEKCFAPLVLYHSRNETKRTFICNKCGEEKSSEMRCDKCTSWNLMPLGIGVDAVVEELHKFFPEIKIYKLDRESVKNNVGAEKIIKEFNECHGAILVGTEMTFFYLKKKVPLSIVASFDSLWSIPNFRMSERIVQLMISIIEKTEKKFVIQTRNSNDTAIKSLLSENIVAYVREELKDRKNLGYPPYKRFIKISYQGDKDKSLYARNYLKETLKEYNPEVYSGYNSRNKGMYTTNALIRLNTKNWSALELSAGSKMDQILQKKFDLLLNQFDITVDPEDLL